MAKIIKKSTDDLPISAKDIRVNDPVKAAPKEESKPKKTAAVNKTCHRCQEAYRSEEDHYDSENHSAKDDDSKEACRKDNETIIVSVRTSHYI